MNKKPYVVSETVDDMHKPVWYCHMEGYPYAPVFESIGDKKHANKWCRMMNKSVGRE